MIVEELKGRVLVDTNVLIYATLAADPRHQRAQEVLTFVSVPEWSCSFPCRISRKCIQI